MPEISRSMPIKQISMPTQRNAMPILCKNLNRNPNKIAQHMTHKKEPIPATFVDELVLFSFL